MPVPRTEIVRTAVQLDDLLDGTMPDGYGAFVQGLERASLRIGLPCFLRTGQTSGKHQWADTCFLTDLAALPRHIAALVEFSALADFMGLPCDVWCAREFLTLDVAYTLPGYCGMPLAREFRFFVRDGKVVCAHTYWPLGAVEEGRPSDPQWREKWEAFACGPDEDARRLAGDVARVFAADGGLSVDVCRTADGRWLVTDMAVAAMSFHWPECPHAEGLA